MRYSPWIASEHVPDMSSLERMLGHPRFAGRSGEELAIALWEFMVDRELGIFHYCPPQNPFWKYDTYDPLQILNVYGFTICHVHANVLGAIGRAAGMRTRIANVTGHEGTEFEYDGGWHYFDCDIQMFHRLRGEGGSPGPVASREELYGDTTLVTDQPNPSRPYHLPDRLPEQIVALYEAEPTYLPVLQERVHSMDYRLRPGESITRYFHNRGRWIVFAKYPEMWRRYHHETGPEGPTERFWPRRQWGNGYFEYRPSLSSRHRDVELGSDEIEGLDLSEDGLVCSGEEGSVVFAFESPYVYCGVPDPMRRLPPADGAMLSCRFEVPEGASAAVEFSREHSGDWMAVWSSGGEAGEMDAALDFSELAEGTCRVRLRVRLCGKGARLTEFSTRFWFMVSPHSLPALRCAGENRMKLHSGDRFGLNTRPLLLQLNTQRKKATALAFASDNLRHERESFERFSPEDSSRPWSVTYELSAPDGGTMQWVNAFTLIAGSRPGEPDDVPAVIEIADSPEGPWQQIAREEIVPHPQGWHFGVFGSGRFSGASEKGYVRFSARKGAKGFRMAGHYSPAPAPPEAVPMEIEHVWYEDDAVVGRRERSHIERTDAAEHEYVVLCAEEPHDERIEMRVPSLPR